MFRYFPRRSMEDGNVDGGFELFRCGGWGRDQDLMSRSVVFTQRNELQREWGVPVGSGSQ